MKFLKDCSSSVKLRLDEKYNLYKGLAYIDVMSLFGAKICMKTRQSSHARLSSIVLLNL